MYVACNLKVTNLTQLLIIPQCTRTQEINVFVSPGHGTSVQCGAHATLHFHGETGCFFVRGMVHGFHKKGVFPLKRGIKSEEKSMERVVKFSPAD